MVSGLLHLLQEYGYIGLFISLVIEFFGIPAPAETMLILTGGSTAHGGLNLAWVIAVGVVGAMTGYAAAFGIGRRIGLERLMRWSRRLQVREHHWRRGERLWAHYGILLLIGSRYIVGVRHVTPYLAGVFPTSPASFLFWSAVGAVAWVVPLVLAGRLVGTHWGSIMAWIESNLILVVALAALALAFVVWLRMRRTGSRVAE
ncbi:MAG TPA: DedA family protein [Limnochordia bacterium]|nr:DedA family protein [Limnochordia bacterium]